MDIMAIKVGEYGHSRHYYAFADNKIILDARVCPIVGPLNMSSQVSTIINT